MLWPLMAGLLLSVIAIPDPLAEVRGHVAYSGPQSPEQEHNTWRVENPVEILNTEYLPCIISQSEAGFGISIGPLV